MVRASSAAWWALLACSASALGASNLQVHVGATAASDAKGILEVGSKVDFGTAEAGVVVPKTFTVRNTSTEPMRLVEPVKVPRGFTIWRHFGTNLLAPGQATTFTVALNSARAGRLGGQVSFEYQGATNGRAVFPVTGTAFGPPAMRIIKSGDPGFRTTGKWASATRADSAGQVHASPKGVGANVATWTFTGLKPGLYQVAATWTANDRQASNARFTVLNGTIPSTPVGVNQRQAPADFQDAGAGWKVLSGRTFITGHSLTVRLTDQADGQVVADAVRIQRIGFPGAIINPGDKGFQTNANFTIEPVPGTRGLTRYQTAARNGQIVWTFSNLVPGQYRVSTSWAANARGATNASYTLLDGNKALTSVEVNQRQTAKDLHDAGRGWQDLGGLGALYPIRGKTLTVVLNLTGANGRVEVGPVRVERVYNPGGAIGPEDTTTADAVRFLEQATWGPNDTEVNNVLTYGTSGYLDLQQGATFSGFPVLPLVADSNTDPHSPCYQLTGQDLTNCNRAYYNLYPLQVAFFQNGMYGADQLRQRMAWALHKIWVISGQDGNLNRGDRYSYYTQILDQNALGNFGDIMYNITLNPAMGEYLSMVNSQKGNPNENYAREILQLFTVGLDLLNPDGTPIQDGQGLNIPTYDQNTVVNFAKAFTGWTYAPPPGNGINTNFQDPMIPRLPQSNVHDMTAKTLLGGAMVPAGQSTEDDLTAALNNIFYHPNVPPFISKSLIQQLVTSNPSPGYVNRVAQVFIDDIGDGTGATGDLLAVAYAILLDPEARGDVQADANYGKLREPAQHTLNLMRAFNATSYDGTTTSDGYLNPQITPSDQDVLRPATVFSYFLPAWNLPGPGHPGVIAPEFQILTNVTTYKRANMVNQMFNPTSNSLTFGLSVNANNGYPTGTRPDLTYLYDPNVGLGADPNGMADYLNYLLMHGTMSDQMYNGLLTAINAVNVNSPVKRAKTAVYLIATSPQYQVQQ